MVSIIDFIYIFTFESNCMTFCICISFKTIYSAAALKILLEHQGVEFLRVHNEKKAGF